MARFAKTPTPNLKDLDLTDAATRKMVSSRASKLRAKQRKGKTITPEEHALLEGWDAHRLKKSGPRAPEPSASPAEAKTANNSSSTAKPAAEPTRGAPSEKAGPAKPEPGGDEPKTEPKPEKPAKKAPTKKAPGPAPKVLNRKGKTESNWRDKYGMASEGREATCREVATTYCMFLYACIEKIEELDGEPILGKECLDADPDQPGEVYAAAVLTADKLIPDDFEPGPETRLAIGSGVIIGQRLWVGHKKKKAEQDKLKGKDWKPGQKVSNVVPINSAKTEAIESAEQADANRKAKEHADAHAKRQAEEAQSDRPGKTITADDGSEIPEGSVF